MMSDIIRQIPTKVGMNIPSETLVLQFYMSGIENLLEIHDKLDIMQAFTLKLYT
jgi:hypothetical protein